MLLLALVIVAVLAQSALKHYGLLAPADTPAICDAIRQGRVALRTDPVPIPELVDVFSRMTLGARRRTTMGHRETRALGVGP